MVVETEVLVRFAETDQMGIVHHATYLVYFEAGRVALSKALNAPYAALEEAGFSLAVTQASLRYVSAARFDQLLTVRTWVDRLASRAVTFKYQIVDANTNSEIATGTTQHFCLDHTGRVARIPERWFNAMKAGLHG